MNSMAATAESNRWLGGKQLDQQAKLLLFCLPYAGGNANAFRAWQGSFPRSIHVSPVHLPGRASRSSERAFTDCRALAAAFATALSEVLDRPYALFGHSMGALIGFEAARILDREFGRAPMHVFVSGAIAPQERLEEEPLHSLPQAEFRKRLSTIEGMPAEVLNNSELMEIVEPLLRADFAVCENYVFVNGPKLRCPITVFAGIEDQSVPLEKAALWRELTSGEFHFEPVASPGHFFLDLARDQLMRAIVGRLSV
jgi:medium-chain acyl-[acyl-carrier-protein] hydrolase